MRIIHVYFMSYINLCGQPCVEVDSINILTGKYLVSSVQKSTVTSFRRLASWPRDTASLGILTHRRSGRQILRGLYTLEQERKPG